MLQGDIIIMPLLPAIHLPLLLLFVGLLLPRPIFATPVVNEVLAELVTFILLLVGNRRQLRLPAAELLPPLMLLVIAAGVELFMLLFVVLLLSTSNPVLFTEER